MYDFKRILAVVSADEDCTPVLEKARIIAAAAAAHTFVVRVVFDALAEAEARGADHVRGMQGLIMEAEQQRYEAIVNRVSDQFEHIQLITTWNKREWDGVLGVARAMGADLIIKSADARVEHDLAAETPATWHLQRNADCPVMLVREERWHDGPIIVAAVDILDETHQQMNESILMEADSLARVLGGNVHVANAYPLIESVAEGAGEVYAADELGDFLVQDIRDRMLSSTGSSRIEPVGIHIREGRPSVVIQTVVEEHDADMVVLGTAGRAGVVGAVMGNTSEMLLGVVNTDVVTLRRERW